MLQINRKYLNIHWWNHALRTRLNDSISGIGFRPHDVSLRVNGLDFRFHVATPLAQNWYEHPDQHSLEMEAIAELMPVAGATVFECGGHHGRDCVLLARLAGPEGRVVSFEPHPENIEVLRRNVRLNDLTNVTAVHAAVGSQAGTARIKARSNAKITTRGKGISVPATTVDGYAAETGIWPDVIKIDVEGFEFEVLRGAREAIRRGAAVLVEVHCDILADFGSEPADFWGLVDAAGCNVYLQRNDSTPAVPVDAGAALSGRPHVFVIPKQPAVI